MCFTNAFSYYDHKLQVLSADSLYKQFLTLIRPDMFDRADRKLKKNIFLKNSSEDKESCKIPQHAKSYS